MQIHGPKSHLDFIESIKKIAPVIKLNGDFDTQSKSVTLTLIETLVRLGQDDGLYIGVNHYVQFFPTYR